METRKHRTKEPLFTVKNAEVEQEILESFTEWGKGKSDEVKYQLVHSWRAERPRCIYVMYYNETVYQ